ncbi:hypothetical protein LOTGIDRAFT_233086 [Lottia gigantea]|uniref:Uncharacterized protein n=1 Tax=Lottia gigantea TaxID=225164 RepID=V3ZMQ2_LOTGI|nr:hypothetical protein LOTGIDRAFT_233086 [Lottia gigantea]ESO92653.1 hypothetical protein LOTGIDRAFT_233086 [Lottia gigantea]
MTSTLRYARGKEVGAVAFNIKEQKFLEKTMQTIEIERNYSLKLLDLNHRIVRVNHKKLKDRVGRIQSHLKADEIQELRDKEATGDLKISSNCINLGSARKIASAAKRLHLSESFKRPSSHATPRMPPETAVLLFRPHSVSGAFMNAPITSGHQHRHHTHLKSNNDPGVNDSVSSKTSDDSSDAVDNATHLPRPNTTVGATRTRSALLPSLSTAPAQSTTQMSTNSQRESNPGFSSHNPLSRTLSRSHSSCRASGVVDEAIESNLGEDIYEERRQDLLRFQEAHALVLEKRKDEFIKDVDSYIEEIKLATKRKKIPQFLERTCSENESDNGEHSFEKSPIPRRRVDFDGIPTHMPEFEYAKRIENLWSGMTKCRYLRIPDEILDLSGIKTLAKDQFQLHTVWKDNAPVN